jgi:predicted DNA-binding protein YlxM (UPF0122 family)
MANLTFEQKNAKQLLADTFASYGLTDPAFIDAIQKAILDNTDAAGNVATSTATAQIRQTDQYKIRFSGNEMRRKAIQDAAARGETSTMSELSEARYIELEDSYREVLKKANVPAQFYSNTTYLAKMIGNDLSTGEVAARASIAKQAASQANPEIKQQLQSLYGISENQISAYFLDPELGKETIGTVAAGNAAILAASAARSGLSLTRGQAEALAQRVAPTNEQALVSDVVFAETSRTAGLAQTSVSGEMAGVNAEDVILASTGNAESQAKLEKERQKRQAEYQSASGMAETQKGVVGLQRANL